MNVSPLLRTASVKTNRSINDRRGVAAVEMALVLPVLLIVVFGTINASQLMHFRKSIVLAASEGIRRASERDSTSADVESLVSAVLSSRRVSNPTITLTPATIESAQPGDVIELQIQADFVGFSFGKSGLGPSVPVTVSTSILRE